MAAILKSINQGLMNQEDLGKMIEKMRRDGIVRPEDYEYNPYITVPRQT